MSEAMPPLDPVPAASGAILVVDDEELVRRLVARMLRSHGYHAVEATDAYEALISLRLARSEARAVVTDIMMPRMSGFQLAAAIRECWPRLPVLGMSGYPTERLSTVPVYDPELPLIYKPFTSGELVTRLQAVMATRGHR